MIRRLCGYQVRIKVNAFRLRVGAVPGGKRLGIGGWPDGRRIEKDYGLYDMGPADGGLQASSSEQNVADPEKGKNPISPFALEKAAEVKALLNSDLSHHYSIAKLARKVGTNAKTLQDGFKQLYGKTIFEYGQGLRLEYGKKLLSETDLGIQEIAEACGYAEQANFTAAFRKRFGVAPGGWRKGVE